EYGRNWASVRPSAQSLRLLGLLRFQWLEWWARLGLNQRPLRCQRSALPLSYAPADRAIRDFPAPQGRFSLRPTRRNASVASTDFAACRRATGTGDTVGRLL